MAARNTPRRVQLWLKSNLSSPVGGERNTKFGGGEDEEEGNNEESNNNKNLNFAAATCPTIDDALAALGSSSSPASDVESRNQSCRIVSWPSAYDWLLDGPLQESVRNDEEYHENKSMLLMKQLYSSQQDFETTCSTLERDPIWGRQSLQFASFEDHVIQEDTDDFGDFQQATSAEEEAEEGATLVEEHAVAEETNPQDSEQKEADKAGDASRSVESLKETGNSTSVKQAASVTDVKKTPQQSSKENGTSTTDQETSSASAGAPRIRVNAEEKKEEEEEYPNQKAGANDDSIPSATNASECTNGNANMSIPSGIKDNDEADEDFYDLATVSDLCDSTMGAIPYLDLYEQSRLDMTSLEGRFLGRLQRQQQQQLEEDNDDEMYQDLLPEEMYLEGNDEDFGSIQILKSLPWKHFPLLCEDRRSQHQEEADDDTSTNDYNVSNFLTQKMSELDSALSVIQKRSFLQIRKRKSSVDLASQQIQQLNHSIIMAELLIRDSQAHVQQILGKAEDGAVDTSLTTNHTGVEGQLWLLDAWNQQQIYRSLDSILLECQDLIRQEAQLQHSISTFHCHDDNVTSATTASIVQSCIALQQSLQQAWPHVGKIHALKELRHRAETSLQTFGLKIQSLMVQHLSSMVVAFVSSSSSPFENNKGKTQDSGNDISTMMGPYQSLWNAALCIQQAQEEGGNKMERMAKDWTESILEALLLEAETSFARALLDPTDLEESIYEKELTQLAFALQQKPVDIGDYSAKLKTISHNLVTIRFDFEASSHNYLARVYHALCRFLANVLYCHDQIMKWHKTRQESSHDDDNDDSPNPVGMLQRVFNHLRESRGQLWDRCVRVVLTCLTEYINFSGKKKLFTGSGQDSLWREDLEGLHDVLLLTEQLFGRVGQEFVSEKPQRSEPIADGTSVIPASVCDKLSAIFRKHIRAVHVDSMNSFGSMLSKESWNLVPLEEVENGLDSFCSLEVQIKSYLSKLISSKLIIPEASAQRRRYRKTRIEQSAQDSWISIYDKAGNPFDIVAPVDSNATVDLFDKLKISSSTQGSALYRSIGALLDGGDLTMESCFAVKSCYDGYAKCIARLLLVVDRLPLIAPEAPKVLQNVTDLFLMTVLRLCVGNESNELLILGTTTPETFKYNSTVDADGPSPRKGSTGNRIGFGRRKSARPVVQPVTATTEAEVCAPLPNEDGIKALRSFCQRAQKSLSGMVKLDMVQKWMPDPAGIGPEESEKEYLSKVTRLLERRQAASWSCLFVAAVLDLVKLFCTQTLSTSASCNKTLRSGTNAVASIVSYIDSSVTIMPKLVGWACMRLACVRVIGGRRIVEEILGTDWDIGQLSEASNRYVDLVCGRFGFVWTYLCSTRALPVGVRKQVWENMVKVGYLTLLEGFARISDCTTEGRSLMSMDLAAFASGMSSLVLHDDIPKPPPVPPEGRQYVDTYIKVSYYPDSDILQWITTHRQDYHANHCLALTNGREELVQKVEALRRVQSLLHGETSEPIIASL